MKRLIFQLACVLLLSGTGWGQWAHVNNVCNVTDESASSGTLTCTVTGTIEAGNVIIVWIASDNVSTTDGQTTLHSVTDSGSNTYTKACEFTNGQGAAAGGATISVHWSTLGTQLTNAVGTITANFSTNVTDKVLMGNEFTKGSGTVTLAGTCQTEAQDGADAGNLTLSSLTSREYLFIRGIGTESNAAISMTGTTSYTKVGNPNDGCDNTTGGGEASDMGACGEFRILTGTGDSSDPTLVDTTNDNASVYVALWVNDGAGPPPCVPTRTLMGVGC